MNTPRRSRRANVWPVPFADCARHRLRRHRHQPSVRAPRGLQRTSRVRRDAGERLRPAVAHHLGAHSRREREVSRLHAARGQPRRGRHPGASRAGAPAGAASGRRDEARACSSCSALFGAALLFGDGIITPAISVLSAVEGLEVATPAFEHFVIPITLAILFGLFCRAALRHGAGGRLFGPVMLIWFVTIGVLGRARDPPRAAHSRGAESHARHPRSSCTTELGGFLVARRGGARRHRRRGAVRGHGTLRQAADPCRLVRGGAPLPAAQLLRPGRAASCATPQPRSTTRSTCWRRRASCIRWWRIATLATIVASQALISGSFSLTQQCVQLGLFAAPDDRPHVLQAGGPDLRARDQQGARRSGASCSCWSSRAREPDGGLRHRRHGHDGDHVGPVRRRGAPALALAALSRVVALHRRFPVIDLRFFAANAVKIASGGWVPIAIARR